MFFQIRFAKNLKSPPFINQIQMFFSAFTLHINFVYKLIANRHDWVDGHNLWHHYYITFTIAPSHLHYNHNSTISSLLQRHHITFIIIIRAPHNLHYHHNGSISPSFCQMQTSDLESTDWSSSRRPHAPARLLLHKLDRDLNANVQTILSQIDLCVKQLVAKVHSRKWLIHLCIARALK